MTRAYLRVDTNYFERCLERGDPPGAVGAYIAILCLAESQPKRGYFRNLAILRALLTPAFARHVAYLIEHGDLVERGKRIYVDGWEEWQEGDWKVAERVERIRKRKARPATPDVTVDVTPDVTAAVTVSRLAEAVGGRRRQGGGGADHRDGGPARLTDILSS
jgi:hypothetical protein